MHNCDLTGISAQSHDPLSPSLLLNMIREILNYASLRARYLNPRKTSVHTVSRVPNSKRRDTLLRRVIGTCVNPALVAAVADYIVDIVGEFFYFWRSERYLQLHEHALMS